MEGRRGFGWVWGLTLAAALSGCEASEDGPQPIPLEQAQDRLQRALCEQVYGVCGCEHGSWYGTQGACNSDMAEAMQYVRSTLEEFAGGELTYDAACMGQLVHQLEALGCSPQFDPVEPQCQPPCLLVHGERQEGESCELYGDLVNDCAQGLLCVGACINPCGGDDPGVYAGEGESCELRPCAQGLQCNFQIDRCERIPAVGEQCPLGQCEGEAFCEVLDPVDPMSERQCFAPGPLGQMCRGHDQCQSGYCPNGFCSVRPGEGESCAGTQICEAGLDCVDETCVPGDPALCRVWVPVY
ncbi:MAG: hypothetical protein AAGF11_49585 [Myxococcota bacterium]